MTISISEFLERISKSATDSDLYLLFCNDLVVFDRAAQFIYLPIATHDTANLNPIGDLRTHIGHGLLWSHQIEIDCTTEQLNNALFAEGYKVTLYQSTNDYRIYTMAK